MAFVSALAACEYRDRATTLSLEHPCYLLKKSETITVHVQAGNGLDEGLNGVKISWVVTPLSLEIDPVETTTAAGRIGGVSSTGIGATVLTLPEDSPIELPALATITASSAIDDTLLSAVAELRLSADGLDTACPETTASDAGTDDAVDAETDAEIDAPPP